VQVKTSLQSRFAVAVLVTTLAVLIRFLLNPVLGHDAPLMVSILAVMFAAWYGGRGSGVLAIALSAVLSVFLFIRPLYSLRIAHFSDVLRLVLFIVIGLLITWLTEALRAAAMERQRSERVSRGQTAVLANTLDALTANPELDTFLRQVLTDVAEQLKSPSASLWFYNAKEGTLDFHIAGGGSGERAAPPAVPEPLLAEETPLWKELVLSQRPLVVTDIENDPRIKNRDRLLAEGVQTLLLVPLLMNDEAIGLLSICSGRHHWYEPEEIELAKALAQQATLAVQLTRLAEQGRQAAVLQERNRLAREIHDTLAQGFTGIVVQVEAAEYVLTKAPEQAREHLARAGALARESLTEARRSVQALRPQALEQSSLINAFARHVEQMTYGTPVQAHFRVHGTPASLCHDKETDLLRIGLEALTNALKHARASVIHVELSFEPEQVRLSVRDDGQGFAPRFPDAADGFGLKGIRERVAHLGGQLTVASRPGQGTEVVAVVPLARLSPTRRLL
jgi:signal transduction histidine kinase